MVKTNKSKINSPDLTPKTIEKLIKKLPPDLKTEIKNLQLDFLKEEIGNISSDLLKFIYSCSN